jgi:pimeloyl-ACP methyl ester carboxylesterase
VRFGVLKGILAASLATLAVAFAAAPASAAPTDWQPCVYAALAYDCATFTFPVDRTGAVSGETKVRAVRVAATEGPRMGTLFVIAGGPGQTAQAMVALMTSYFEGANRYDIVGVDQRGSGTSEPLNCPRLETGGFTFDGGDPTTDRPFTDCSVSLGAQRAGYNTAEAVADLDAVRAELGVDTASFFGVSYGTKVALAYAQAHPSNTKALLIDSVLPTNMPGAFDLDSFAASRGALRRICASGRCNGIGGSPVSNMAKLATRLERKPVTTFLVSPTGKVSETKLDAIGLTDILFSADLNFFIYNQIPGMLTQSLRGDTAQLERLYAIVNGAFGASDTLAGAKRIARRIPKSATTSVTRKPGDRLAGRDAEALAQFSNTMFFATTCADFNPPWTRSLDVSNRQPAIVAAANAIPESSFYPFSRTTGRDNSTSAYCRGWQQQPTPPAIAQGPLPDVPTLALNGDLDLRTPTAWAKRATSGDSKAQVIQIENAGHSVIGTDVSGCALSLAKRFLIFGATNGKCDSAAPPVPIAPRPVTSLNNVRSLPGTCSGLRGAACTRAKRILLAGYLGLRDTIDQAFIGYMDVGPGLLGGIWEMEYDLADDLSVIPVGLQLTGVSNVPGVYVSGSMNFDTIPQIDSTLRIGPYRTDVSGRIRYDRAGDDITLHGRRGNTRVSIRIRPDSRRAASASISAAKLKFQRNYALAASPPISALPK